MAEQIVNAKTTQGEPAGSAKKTRETRSDTPRNGIAEWAVTLLLLLFGTTTLVQAFVIPTGSMEDTLLVGDHLLVDKLAYAPAGPVGRHLLPYEAPKHGDIIVFRYPVDNSQTFVKRVIGVPGDHIKIVDEKVYRNGIPLNEPYTYFKPVLNLDPYGVNFPGQPPSYGTERDSFLHNMLDDHVVKGEVVVPPESYFAMGDNRNNSLDSRYWGFVPRDNIIGKPLLIYWSYAASTEDLAGTSVNSILTHFVDLAEHFFTRTRWNRTLHVIRGFPDSKLPNEPVAQKS